MFLGSSRCVRESGSPWIRIKKRFFPHLFFCHTVNVTAILAFCITTQKEWRKELRLPLAVCLNGFCKGGSVIFGFHLVWRCLSAALYFIRNQSLMLQENSPVWAQSHQKGFSLKENLMKCKREVWKQEASFESMLSLGCLRQTSVYFLMLMVPSWLRHLWPHYFLFLQMTEKKKKKKGPNIYNHSTRNGRFNLSALQIYMCVRKGLVSGNAPAVVGPVLEPCLEHGLAWALHL